MQYLHSNSVLAKSLKYYTIASLLVVNSSLNLVNNKVNIYTITDYSQCNSSYKYENSILMHVCEYSIYLLKKITPRDPVQ